MQPSGLSLTLSRLSRCPKCNNVWKIKTTMWSGQIKIDAKEDVKFSEDKREGIRFVCKKCGTPVATLKWEELKD